MEFTDGLFSFPTKVYDTFSVMKNFKEEVENMEELEGPLPDDWVEGDMYWPITDIQGFSDEFSSQRKTGEVAKEGFDMTTIYTKSGKMFECLWPAKRLKQELNEFANKYQKGIENMVTDAFKEKERELMLREVKVVSSKPSKWKGFFRKRR